MTKSSTEESLCCCEYRNEDGARSHILGCFCDCEALDQAFDRCITCRPIPKQLSERMWRTIADRCRIPGLSGSGAIRVKIDVVVPIVTVPISLCLGTINFYMTIFVLASMPIFMFLFYRSWRTQHNRVRTKFFYAWAMTSVLFTILIYHAFVLSFREVFLWEQMLLVTSIGIMFFALTFVRKDPGIIKPASPDTVTPSNQHLSSSQDQKDAASQKDSKDDYSKTISEHVLGNFLLSNMGFDKESFKANYQAQTAPSMPEQKVTWVDSRPIKDNQLVTWCDKCCLVKPPRAGHCHVCQACILNRDHHCVWVDNCIGAHNHRSFLVAILLFVFTGFYGAHLTLTTICTPEMYYDWFLLPNDCRYVYADFSTALCFVCACYAILGSSIMCVALLLQLLLISQNITSQELHMAAVRGMTVLGLYARGNIHDRGCLWNWLEFIRLKTRRTSPQIPF
ncbi:palmitoyltransferase ZDHHC23-like [Liolophura sinensis]|uniref:palmitoyltransferase ZDHHC23-like n=1 Tax=Liolophura sinensis TaxID=3198878 RepID=UPI0031596777